MVRKFFERSFHHVQSEIFSLSGLEITANQRKQVILKHCQNQTFSHDTRNMDILCSLEMIEDSIRF